MLELAADLRLVEEAVDQLGLARVLAAHDLERDVATEPVVVRAVDDAHAAARDLAEHAVAARPRAGAESAAAGPRGVRAKAASSPRSQMSSDSSGVAASSMRSGRHRS